MSPHLKFQQDSCEFVQMGIRGAVVHMSHHATFTAAVTAAIGS